MSFFITVAQGMPFRDRMYQIHRDNIYEDAFAKLSADARPGRVPLLDSGIGISMIDERVCIGRLLGLLKGGICIETPLLYSVLFLGRGGGWH